MYNIWANIAGPTYKPDCAQEIGEGKSSILYWFRMLLAFHVQQKSRWKKKTDNGEIFDSLKGKGAIKELSNNFQGENYNMSTTNTFFFNWKS